MGKVIQLKVMDLENNMKEKLIDFLEKIIIGLKDDIHYIQNKCHNDIEVLEYMLSHPNCLRIKFEDLMNIKR